MEKAYQLQWKKLPKILGYCLGPNRIQLKNAIIIMLLLHSTLIILRCRN